jgi:soluble lytic murein transglycosylase-like protein
MSKELLAIFFVLILCSSAAADDFCFAAAEKQYNIDRRILYSISMVESGVDNSAVSPAGARGHMQIHEWWGFSEEELNDPCFVTMAGAAILNDCFQSYGNAVDAFSCYNSGKPLSKLTYEVRRKVNTYISRVYTEIGRF